MTPYYDDGQITIYCGDCRDILPTLEARSIDLVLTDPPYGIADIWNGGGGTGNGSWRFRATDTHAWDRETVDIVPELPAMATAIKPENRASYAASADNLEALTARHRVKLAELRGDTVGQLTIFDAA